MGYLSKMIIMFFAVGISASKGCIKYNFEDGEDDQYQTCSGRDPWILKSYEEMQMIPPVAQSKKALFTERSSCLVTDIFTLEEGGILEFNVYFQSSSEAITVGGRSTSTLVLISIYDSDSPEIPITTDVFSPRTSPIYVDVWNKLTMNVLTNITKGYVTILGDVDEHRSISIDSFRYYLVDEENCSLYIKDDSGETVTDDPPEENTANDNKLRPIFIFLIAFVCFLVVILVAFGCYQYGFNMGRAATPPAPVPLRSRQRDPQSSNTQVMPKAINVIC